MKRLVLNLPDEAHARLKAIAAERGETLAVFLKAALFDNLVVSDDPHTKYGGFPKKIAEKPRGGG